MLKTTTILTKARKHLNIDRVRSHSLHTHGHFSFKHSHWADPVTGTGLVPVTAAGSVVVFRTCSGESNYDRLLLSLLGVDAVSAWRRYRRPGCFRLFTSTNAAFRVCGKDGTFFTSWHLWHPFYVTWSTNLPISCSPRAGVSHRWAWRSLVKSDFLTAAT